MSPRAWNWAFFCALPMMVFLPAFSACEGGASERDGGNGTEPWSCDGEDVWEDPATGLCWMREDGKLFFSNNDYTRFMNWFDAAAVCSNLDWGGYADWRLPKIQELVGLVRGCPSETCPVHDPDCLMTTCDDAAQCEECEWKEGPGLEGCYWPEEMGPECPLAYWSGSISATYTELAWTLDYSVADVYPWNRNANTWPVRCVRGD